MDDELRPEPVAYRLGPGSQAPVLTVSEMIGRNVRKRREALGWTQTQLGDALEMFLGQSWTKQQIYQAEKGGRVFNASDVTALALALDTVPGNLFNPPRVGPPGLTVAVSAEIGVNSYRLQTAAIDREVSLGAIRNALLLAIGNMERDSDELLKRIKKNRDGLLKVLRVKAYDDRGFDDDEDLRSHGEHQ